MASVHLQESGDTLGADRLRSMALHSLSAMAAGGMCDQLGGGFHRYSVDELWWVEVSVCVWVVRGGRRMGVEGSGRRLRQVQRGLGWWGVRVRGWAACAKWINNRCETLTVVGLPCVGRGDASKVETWTRCGGSASCCGVGAYTGQGPGQGRLGFGSPRRKMTQTAWGHHAGTVCRTLVCCHRKARTWPFRTCVPHAVVVVTTFIHLRPWPCPPRNLAPNVRQARAAL